MRQGGSWLPLWFVAGLVPLLILGVAVPPLGLVAIGYGMIGLPSMIYARRRRRRQQFIAKVRATGALPAPEPEQEHERRARALESYARKRHEARIDAAGGVNRSREDVAAAPAPDPGPQPE